MTNPFSDLVDKHTGPVNRGADNGERAQLPPEPGLQATGAGGAARPGLGVLGLIGAAPADFAGGYGEGAFPGHLGEAAENMFPPEAINRNSLSHGMGNVAGFLTSPFYNAEAKGLEYITPTMGKIPLVSRLLRGAFRGAGYGATEAAGDQAANAINGAPVDPYQIPERALYSAGVMAAPNAGLEKGAEWLAKNRVGQQIAEGPLSGRGLGNATANGKNPVGGLQDLGVNGSLAGMQSEITPQLGKNGTATAAVSNAKEGLFQAAEKDGTLIPTKSVVQPYLDAVRDVARVGSDSAKQTVNYLMNRASDFMDRYPEGISPRELDAEAEAEKKMLRQSGARASDAAYSLAPQPNQPTDMDIKAGRILIGSASDHLHDLSGKLLNPSEARAYAATMDKYGKLSEGNRLLTDVRSERAGAPSSIIGTVKNMLTPFATTLGQGVTNLTRPQPSPYAANIFGVPNLHGPQSLQDLIRMVNVGAQNGKIDVPDDEEAILRGLHGGG